MQIRTFIIQYPFSQPPSIVLAKWETECRREAWGHVLTERRTRYRTDAASLEKTQSQPQVQSPDSQEDEDSSQDQWIDATNGLLTPTMNSVGGLGGAALAGLGDTFLRGDWQSAAE